MRLSDQLDTLALQARYIRDLLAKMLGTPMYLDSANLNDLRALFSEGVRQSDVLIVLFTPSVLTRPWCLLEILEADRTGIPIVVLNVAGGLTDGTAEMSLMSNRDRP